MATVMEKHPVKEKPIVFCVWAEGKTWAGQLTKEGFADMKEKGLVREMNP